MIPNAATVLEQLAQSGTSVLSLLTLYLSPQYAHIWSETPQVSQRFAKLLLEQGHPASALEVTTRALGLNAAADSSSPFRDDAELQYLRALSLARCGNPTHARKAIHDLLDRTDLTSSSRMRALSLAGRVRKDLALRCSQADIRRQRLREALEYYLLAYAIDHDTFPGINAASLAWLVGETQRSVELARQVRERAQREFDSMAEFQHWSAATLGEAALLLGDLQAAYSYYEPTVRASRAAHRHGDIATMRRQLELLGDSLPISEELWSLFAVSPVVVFAGHGIDAPGSPPRFPPSRELASDVRAAIAAHLESLGTTIGYYAPACGSDLLFGEVLSERGAEAHLVLPFYEPDLIADRVTYQLPELTGWHETYLKLSKSPRATRHFATSEQFLNDQELYDFGGRFMQGLALTRAAEIGAEAVAVVVQDPSQQTSDSGLSKFLASWVSTGSEVVRIDLAALRQPYSLTPWSSRVPYQPPRQPEYARSVKTMLFADVENFSKLSEAQLPDFFQKFLSCAHDELQQVRPLFANTWGDGLYVVFDDVVRCATFTLRLLKRFGELEQSEFGAASLHEINIRIGLHTGPVYEVWDPILARPNFYGSHVSRAARIEPAAATGCAYVSEQFAAALALATDHDFVCEYLGRVPLAKGYDVANLYRLTRRNED